MFCAAHYRCATVHSDQLCTGLIFWTLALSQPRHKSLQGCKTNLSDVCVMRQSMDQHGKKNRESLEEEEAKGKAACTTNIVPLTSTCQGISASFKQHASECCLRKLTLTHFKRFRGSTGQWGTVWHSTLQYKSTLQPVVLGRSVAYALITVNKPAVSFGFTPVLLELCSCAFRASL